MSSTKNCCGGQGSHCEDCKFYTQPMESLKQMHERFDERFFYLKNIKVQHYFAEDFEKAKALVELTANTEENLKSFIESEIQLARKEAEQEFRKILNSGRKMYELGKKEVEENLEESVWAKSYFLMAKDEGKKEMLEKLTPRIGMLRQWLNEERITDKKMVTSEDIKDWLGLSALNEE